MDLAFDSLLNPPEIKVPPGAEDLFPTNIGPKLFALHSDNQILKAGPDVKMSEAEAMRFVAEHTSVPVPRIHRAYMENGAGYIFMSRVEGERLADVWQVFDDDQKAAVTTQLKGFVQELRLLHGEFFGALWNQPSEDVFFIHHPFKPVKISYGPFSSRLEYNAGLVRALANSRPETAPDDTADLAQRLMAIDDETKVFTHGDLHTENILADRSTARITGIVDWEAAGFSIQGREYYQARKLGRNEAWIQGLEEIFPLEERMTFDLLQELDQALIRYTLI